MDSKDLPTTQDILLRIAHLEQRSRRFRLRAALMTVVVAALALAGFRDDPEAQNAVVTARTLVLVDSLGTPAARIRWEDEGLRIEIPPQIVDTVFRMAPRSQTDSAGVLGIIPRPQHQGAELLLRTGPSGPSLILADAHGHGALRVSNDAVRRVGW